jgi:hypothetical protein
MKSLDSIIESGLFLLWNLTVDESDRLSKVKIIQARHVINGSG